MSKLKVGVLISGGGSNLQALIDACADPDFPAEIVQVISNVPDTYGLTRASEAGIPTAVINHKEYPNRETFDDDIHQCLTNAGVELICSAGFMRIMTSTFMHKWLGRMINIHPALLPKHKGLHTHQRALDEGDTEAGCTVHFVTVELDDGPLIIQASVPIEENDTAETLAARVLIQEHKIYPAALGLIAKNAVTIEGRDAFIKGHKGPLIHAQ